MRIAQLGELQTEDLKVACSVHAHCISFFKKNTKCKIIDIFWINYFSVSPMLEHITLMNRIWLPDWNITYLLAQKTSIFTMYHDHWRTFIVHFKKIWYVHHNLLWIQRWENLSTLSRLILTLIRFDMFITTNIRRSQLHIPNLMIFVFI